MGHISYCGRSAARRPPCTTRKRPARQMGAEQFLKSNSSDRSLNCYVDAHKTQKMRFGARKSRKIAQRRDFDFAGGVSELLLPKSSLKWLVSQNN